MKTFPIALANHYALGTTRLSAAIRIERTDGEVFAFTEAQIPALIDAVKYQKQGLALSDIASASDMSVSNLELSTLDDGSIFSRADIFGGVWKNARFLIFRYNRLDPAGGINPLMAGTFGDATILRNVIVIELRSLMQYLQQPVGNISTKTCRARLGDSLCTVDLAPFTFTGTLTQVTNNQVFRDSSRAEAAAYFAEGILTFTSGDCEGLSQKVKLFATDGTFTLSLPMFSTVAVGDTYSVLTGCQKRLEDCRDKFNNVLNFQREPHRPGVDQLTSAPEPSV